MWGVNGPLLWKLAARQWPQRAALWRSQSKQCWARASACEAVLAPPDSQSLRLVPGLTHCCYAEYMGGGSLKSALLRKADIVAGALTRVVLALDAAKVRPLSLWAVSRWGPWTLSSSTRTAQRLNAREKHV